VIEETRMGTNSEKILEVNVKSRDWSYRLALDSLGPGFSHTVGIGKLMQGNELGLTASVDYLKKKAEATDKVPIRLDSTYGGEKSHIRTINNTMFGIYVLYTFGSMELGGHLGYLKRLLKESTDEGTVALEDLKGLELAFSLNYSLLSTGAFDFITGFGYEYQRLSGSIESRSYELDHTTVRTENQSFEDDTMQARTLRFKLLGVRMNF